MKIVTTNTRYFAAQVEGVTLGPWYVDQAKAQAAVDSLNREWNGVRTYRVHSWEMVDTITVHES